MKEIYSIGVDIGTSTTNVILSKIQIDTRMGTSLIPVTKIENAQVVYKSPVIFTPVREDNQIDFVPVIELVKQGLLECGIKKEEIETGAVIITGETARKENAAGVGEELSEYLGDFVVACAGPCLESVLAGHGSGASRISKEKSKRVLNLDIGGGTLNAAVFYCGKLEQSFAMDIGGRLVRFDEGDKISYLSERISFLIEQEGLSLQIGKEVRWQDIEVICERLAEYCVEASGLKPISESARKLLLSDYKKPEKIDLITVSGGVGECMKESGFYNVGSVSKMCRLYGDMGPLLAKKLSRMLSYYPKYYYPDAEGIRATVIGAGSHSMSVSGSTIGVDAEILPVKNIPIIKSALKPEQWSQLGEEIGPKLKLYGEDWTALALCGEASPGYEKLKILANQIGILYRERKQPVILLIREDFAKALRQVIRIHEKISQPVLCLDGIDTATGDYIDIGTPIGSAVPVVVKTLIYKS
ncbi:MAG: ethanolamine ammonia-lyase reactivating factor EutA [Lachnospiraceae bacterium]|nr:ethanolamine ammonia-lyase reactivating factor EutA [Lachnospiraceae bacterium]